MEWYYILLIVLGILSLTYPPIWWRMNSIDKKFDNHLRHYAKFIGRVDTTIDFFKGHFEELNKALNKKQNKKVSGE